MPKFKRSGGPVQTHEIYIERKTDRRVLQLVEQMEYVHLIAPRQMGKTSLMYHLLLKLRERGWRGIYVDLSALTRADETKWYYNLGQSIGLQLTPEHIPKPTNPSDLKNYFVETLASEPQPAPIVIVFDEIGSLSRLDSGEQFLMTLRTMYRKPIDFPILEHLTFILTGTVDPDTMVKDASISPFNVGERVTLSDFTSDQTRQLTQHLEDDDAFGKNNVSDAVHACIYQWTGGQPYLTQKVCAILEQEYATKEGERLTPQDVDRVVREHFLNPPDLLAPDSNIKHVLDGLQDQELGRLFVQICAGNPAPKLEGKRLYQLYLLGAIKRHGGRLVARNQIYKELTILEQVDAQEFIPTIGNKTVLAGQTLGQYRLLEQIGQGAMATVYKGYHPALERYVAIKVLSTYHLADKSDFAARFEQEAKSVAWLNHPYILPVYDFGREGKHSYIVMRYVEGGTLKERLGKPMELERAVELIAQVGAALDYAHRHGVVHRDVKPANILIDEEGRPLLSDFGLARIMASSVQLTQSGTSVMGTLAYTSPEQVQERPVDGRADIYSLGVILYEMLTGQVPFEAETPAAMILKRIQDLLPLPRQINPDIPETVEQVILKALAKNPDDRYATVKEMAAALREATIWAGSQRDDCFAD